MRPVIGMPAGFLSTASLESVRPRTMAGPKASIALCSHIIMVVETEHYNLLVTFQPNRAGLAEKEVRERIDEAGWAVEDVQRSSVNGVFCVRVAGNAKEVVGTIRAELREHPEMLSHTHHWVPVDTWVDANDEDMIDAVNEAAEGIGEHESWMMHMHKRHNPRSSEELVLALTDQIQKGRVDLKRPEKIIAVEILGNRAAISLLERGEIIDLNRLRLEAGLTQIV